MDHKHSLPLELVDYIFSFLRDDIVSLHACACVNETFRNIAERHIYHHVVLHNSMQPSDGYLSTTPAQLSNILAISPHISSYVKSLQVSVTFPGVLRWFMTRSLNDEEIAPILPKLSHLERLSITGWKSGRISWNELHSTLQTSLIHTFDSPSVAEVVVNGVDQFPLSALDSCRMLKNLSLMQSTFVLETNPLQNNKSRPCLRALTIQVSGLSLPTVMDWLFDTTTSPDVRSLQFLHVATSSSSRIFLRHLLPVCAESLQVLELDPGAEANSAYDLYTGVAVVKPAITEPPLDLSKMRRLRSISVIARVWCVADFWVSSTGDDTVETSVYSSPFAWLAQIFGTAPPSLTHISLNLSFNINKSSFGRINWKDLAQTLLYMESLQRVAFVVSSDASSNLSTDALVIALQNEEHLSKLIQRGVLVISKSSAPKNSNYRTRL